MNVDFTIHKENYTLKITLLPTSPSRFDSSLKIYDIVSSIEKVLNRNELKYRIIESHECTKVDGEVREQN